MFTIGGEEGSLSSNLTGDFYLYCEIFSVKHYMLHLTLPVGAVYSNGQIRILVKFLGCLRGKFYFFIFLEYRGMVLVCPSHATYNTTNHSRWETIVGNLV